MAQRQLVEVMADDGTNIPQHFKAIGFVNGLGHFTNILQAKLDEYKEKAEKDNEEKPNSIQS